MTVVGPAAVQQYYGGLVWHISSVRNIKNATLGVIKVWAAFTEQRVAKGNWFLPLRQCNHNHCTVRLNKGILKLV